MSYLHGLLIPVLGVVHLSQLRCSINTFLLIQTCTSFTHVEHLVPFHMLAVVALSPESVVIILGRNYSLFTHRTCFPLSPAPSEITANAFSVSRFADGKHFLQVESCSIDFDRLLLLSSVLSLRQVVKIYSYDWVLLFYTAIPYFVDPFLCWWKFGNYQWCCFEYQHTICDYFFLDFLPNVSPEFHPG